MNSSKLIFSGFSNRDVYNITAPFDWNGKKIIAGRVEKRRQELSEIVFFQESEGVWNPLDEIPSFPGLQDPCITRINDKLILGGVRFPVSISDSETSWQMEFFVENEDRFEKIFTGPPNMKDIRLLQLPCSRILVLTRPQGKRGGRGKIGFCVVDSLEALTHGLIENAPLFDLCPKEKWVGANEAHLLKGGKIGVLGHLAEFSEDGHRHYFSMVFSIDLKSGTSTQPEIVARRSDFPPGESKRSDLVDVIFSGGLKRIGNGRSLLYAGLSDAESGVLELPDPFDKFEF